MRQEEDNDAARRAFALRRAVFKKILKARGSPMLLQRLLHH